MKKTLLVLVVVLAVAGCSKDRNNLSLEKKEIVKETLEVTNTYASNPSIKESGKSEDIRDIKFVKEADRYIHPAYTWLSATEKDVLSGIGDDPEVINNQRGADRIYIYGNLTGEDSDHGRVTSNGLAFFFKDNICVCYNKVYAGSTRHPESYPKIKEALPPSFLSIPCEIKEGDENMNVITWDFDKDQWQILAFKTSSKKYNPDINQYEITKDILADWRVIQCKVKLTNK